ncbi:MAG: TetR/AcrR family transcriptional regulator [Caballeronia sp.]|jgi:AcrR family transcriptional regulator|nr:TetR/AcrR family transcriptional regulator [Caballeronia sp.]
MNLSKPGNASDGRSRILAAALDVFATSGFEGSSLRQIASHAGEMHQLVVYHFKTKDALWREVVRSIFAESTQERSAAYWAEKAVTDEPGEVLREMFLAFAIFTAQHPEFHRLLSFEAQINSDRFDWLIESYVRPSYEISTQAIRTGQQAGVVRAGDPGQLHYAVIGVITTSIVFANEYSRMTGLNPRSPEEVEKTVNLVCDLLGLPSKQNRPCIHVKK